MFGINDGKTSGQDPVMPQPLESDEPDATFPAAQDAATAPPLVPEPSSVSSYTPVPEPPATPSAPDTPDVPDAPDAEEHAEELLKIKQQALTKLAPLVGKLDQTPEEKFKTTMMMLQASDNPDLVQEAYAAANRISDEKVRAQALLDVVNEINYFTHHDAA